MNRLNQLPAISFNTSFRLTQFCAIANFRIEDRDHEKITEYLMAKHKIIATPIVHDEFSGIRITPNIFTRLVDLDRFCPVIENVFRGLRIGGNHRGNKCS
ncbi:MAG: hypothetical protein ABIU09_04340 [Pyrinomonadaceae bacterium]